MKEENSPELKQQNLQLIYRNGNEPSPQAQVPVYRDIYLAPKSQDQCDALVTEANRLDKPIRNESDEGKLIELRKTIAHLVRALRQLATDARAPWEKGMQQITSAIEPTINKLVISEGHLRRRLEDWRAVVVEGQRLEQERLAAKAMEQRNIATFSDSPAKKRKAKVQAAQLALEAHRIAPKAASGYDTVEYYEFEINNRLLASKLPSEAVSMTINERWFNQAIAEKKKMGISITPNIFPGITVTRKTRLRFHA